MTNAERPRTPWGHNSKRARRWRQLAARREREARESRRRMEAGR